MAGSVQAEDSCLPTVAIVTTGGTIAEKIDSKNRWSRAGGFRKRLNLCNGEASG